MFYTPGWGVTRGRLVPVRFGAESFGRLNVAPQHADVASDNRPTLSGFRLLFIASHDGGSSSSPGANAIM